MPLITLPKIVRNAIKCNHCGEVVESKFTHDFKTCKCGRVYVDGGLEYLHRGWTDSEADYEELSEYGEEITNVKQVSDIGFDKMEVNDMFGTFLPGDLRIEEGHNGGACFWIMPVKIFREADKIEKGDEVCFGVLEHRNEEVSIDEDIVECFLYHFLKKHYDKDLSVAYRNHASMDFHEKFEWNLEYNVYTYDAIQKMIHEINEVMKLLTSKQSTPVLDELIEKHPFLTVNNDVSGERKEVHLVYSDAERKTDWTVNGIVDFYNRFCNRIEKMMENSPRFCHISFMGP